MSGLRLDNWKVVLRREGVRFEGARICETGILERPSNGYALGSKGRKEAGCGMARIGVISDTHGVLPVEAFNALADCEHIIHAGDICSPEIIRDLQTLAPVTAVLGNNDFNEYGTSVCRYARPVIDGVRFLVAHYPRDVRITFAGSSALPSPPRFREHGYAHECTRSAADRPAQARPSPRT